MIQIFHCIRSEMLPGSRESRLYDVRTGRYDLWSGRRAGKPIREEFFRHHEACTESDDRRGLLASSTLLRLGGRKT